MSNTFTLTAELLRKIKIDEPIYLTDILLVFAQRGNPFKLSCDINDVVINLYKSVEQNKEFVSVWLNLLSFNPKPFDYIQVDIGDIACEETQFLKLCKATNGSKRMIVYSNQCLLKHKVDDCVINFENEMIYVVDRDMARNELRPRDSGDTIINSIVAKNGSKISDSENS